MDILLLTVGLLGILVILFSRQAVMGGIVTWVSFLSYFLMYGTGKWIYLFLLFFGFLLLVLEMIVPSFGIIGIVGLILIGFSLYTSSIDPLNTAFNIGVALILVTCVALVLVKSGYQLQLGRGLVLTNQMDKKSGFQSYQVNYAQYLNQIGRTTTSLRPVGRAMFSGEEIDVLSSGKMIDSGEKVVVYKVEANNVYVRKI